MVELIDTVAFIERHEEPVTLSSGRLSHWYVDADRIFESPLRDVVLGYWLSLLGNMTHLTPVETGGRKWADALGEALDQANLSVTAAPDEPEDGTSYVVIEDVVTTGASALKVVDELRAGQDGALYVPVLAVVQRSVDHELRGDIAVFPWLKCWLPDEEAPKTT
jgi:orotate phosphoribosyltransferase